MARIISIINQKGGVGKSTTAEALLAGLTLKGYKTLAVDLDAQGNLTYATGANSQGATSLGVLTREVDAGDAIQHTPSGDIIPSNKALAGADAFITDTGKEYRLKEALESVASEYDYIIIDTPPALSILTINALTASNSLIIPAQADIYSLQGIEQLAETIQPVKRYCNPTLSIEGIITHLYPQPIGFNSGWSIILVRSKVVIVNKPPNGNSCYKLIVDITERLTVKPDGCGGKTYGVCIVIIKNFHPRV